MKHSLLAIGFLAVSLAASAGADPGASSAGDWRDARPDAQVHVSRGSAPGTYDVKATIADLRSGKVLAQPRLVARAGQPAVVDVGAKGAQGMVSVHLTVTVASSGDTAAYTGEVRDNDVVVSAQRATLAVSH